MSVTESSLEFPGATRTRETGKTSFAKVNAVAWSVFRHTFIVIAFFLLWEFAPRIGLVEPSYLPPVSQVLAAGWKLLLNGQLFDHFGTSLFRSIAGFTIAVVTGIPIGLAMGRYRLFTQIVNPLLEMFRNTSALALLPVFMLFFGIGELSKVLVIVFGCLFPIVLNTIAGVVTVDPLLIKSARTMGLSPVKLFYKVILPASIPTIFVGIRMAGAVSLLILIAAEMVGSKSGLGYLIQYSQFNFQVPEMFLGILCITLTGLAVNYLLVGLERHFTSWKRNSTDT